MSVSKSSRHVQMRGQRRNVLKIFAYKSAATSPRDELRVCAGDAGPRPEERLARQEKA